MSENISYPQVLEVAKIAAKKAGAFIRESWTKKDVEITFKDKTNLVTQYDLGAEEIIISTIKANFPNHGLLTEETNASITDIQKYLDPLWVVDPIDGTTNFAHRHPHSATSIGFANNGQLMVGVVYNPFTEELYHAIAGQGAFKNDTPIKCSPCSELKDALLATGFPYLKSDLDILMSRVRSVLLNCREIRRLGAASLDICWVAEGRLDGFYETLSPWDIAGATVIAKEAGLIHGHIGDIPKDLNCPTDFYCKDLLYANPKLFPQLKKLFSE